MACGTVTAGITAVLCYAAHGMHYFASKYAGHGTHFVASEVMDSRRAIVPTEGSEACLQGFRVAEVTPRVFGRGRASTVSNRLGRNAKKSLGGKEAVDRVGVGDCVDAIEGGDRQALGADVSSLFVLAMYHGSEKQIEPRIRRLRDPDGATAMHRVGLSCLSHLSIAQEVQT